MAELPIRGKQIALAGGRSLGMAEYGAAQGEPVFYFHGWPSSRLEAEFLDPLAREFSLRVIALDRPGYGLSDYLPGRTLEDWPRDVSAAADFLGLKSVSLVGVSGGAPYAAVCAAKLGDRVKRALLVCPMGPLEAPGAMAAMPWPNRFMLGLSRKTPRLGVVLGALALRHVKRRLRRTTFPAQNAAGLPECDRISLAHSGLGDILLRSCREAFRLGTRGPALDGCLYGRKWNFPLESIRVPVQLWHGELDTLVPAAMGRHYARAIPGCQAKFYPDEGHFSLISNRSREILSDALDAKS